MISYFHMGFHSHMVISHLFMCFGCYNKHPRAGSVDPHFSSRLKREMGDQRLSGEDPPGF